MSANCLIHLTSGSTSGIYYTDTGRGFMGAYGCEVPCTCSPSPSDYLKMSGIGMCRTLTGPEEHYEAMKAATAKRKNSHFRAPRHQWWWSSRVEELYNKYLLSELLERTGACTPQCSCEILGEPCGDRQESEEEPAFVPGKRTDSVIGLTNQGKLARASKIEPTTERLKKD